MVGSFALYSGVSILLCGLVLAVRPSIRLRVPSRRRAVAVALAGILTAVGALGAPTFDSHATPPTDRLDEFVPVWQFREVHVRKVHAPPERVFDAIRKVRADEILLFQTLTWIRRGGQPAPPGILRPGTQEPIIDVATKGGFVILSDDAPRELVLGAIVARPGGPRIALTPNRFRQPFPSGFALAAMSFRAIPDGADGSIVSTETRVVAHGPAVRRQFAAYWRAIYPGSALIRRMWLRAIDRRATS